MKSFNIGNKTIGKNNRVFIIAEAGVNHNGDVELAKKLILAAKKAGADAIKFQTFKAENLVTEYAELADYAKQGNESIKNQFELLKSLELEFKTFKTLKDFAEEKNIIFLSTPHDFESLEYLLSINITAIKIASGDLTNIPFLKKAAAADLPILISTGMGTLDEIKKAIKTIEDMNNFKICIFQCTTSYPVSYEDVNLNVLNTFKNGFNYPIGFSDHTMGISISLASVPYGISMLEKHFTLDKNMLGPDHKASIDPQEFKQLVEEIRNIEAALGIGIKKPTNSEIEIKKIVRKSLVAARLIEKGSIITKEDISIKRPGTGLSPEYYYEIIGKKAKNDIKKDTLILRNMLE